MLWLKPLCCCCAVISCVLCCVVLQGSARVIRCLQNQRDKLSSVCRSTLMSEEVKFSENIDFQYPMKQACAREVEQFCDVVPHGGGRVIRCLQASTPANQQLWLRMMLLLVHNGPLYMLL